MSDIKGFLGGRVSLRAGDCLDVIKTLADNSVDSVVTDPPYALVSIVKRFGKTSQADDTQTSDRSRKGSDGYARLAKGFMGKEWDNGETAFAVEFWAEVLRVLKPGGHVAAFGGTRSYHRLACAIEDAGFEIRDQLGWCYGTGFPKSHSVAKGIVNAFGATRVVVGRRSDGIASGTGEFTAGNEGTVGYRAEFGVTIPATDAAREWDGWGTALKPSYEPILFGSKPLTVAQHVAISVQELTLIILEAARWSNCNASDAERRSHAILAKCDVEANSVLDGARMRSLESIGIAKSAAQSSTFSALASIDLIRTRGCSALSHVAPNGSLGEIQDKTTEAGLAVDILTRLMAMSTSVMLEGMSESIVSSWLKVSDDLLQAASRFTTSTASKLTTALRTLNCSMLPNISADTGRLTPSWEPICLARKPLGEGTVAANVLRHGTGAINVDGCRVETSEQWDGRDLPNAKNGVTWGGVLNTSSSSHPLGRWPANIVHDGSAEVVAMFPDSKRQQGDLNETGRARPTKTCFGDMPPPKAAAARNDSGSAARFFYSAKASKHDRAGSKHPTVKPVNLMRWLCRLITPPGGTVLDPFAGTGSTGTAAYLEGFRSVLIEREAEYVADIEGRMRALAVGVPDDEADDLPEAA